MKSDLFLLELEAMLRARRIRPRSSRDHQRQLQRLHAAALRRALRRIRATATQSPA